MKNYAKFDGCFLLMAQVMLAGLWFSGCASRIQKMQDRLDLLEDARLNSTIRKSIAASGGIDAWSSVRQITGDVIATIFETQEFRPMITQLHRIVPDDKVAISIASHEPGGVLQEQLDRKGVVSIMLDRAKEPIHETDPDKLYGAAIKLRLLAQGMTGAAGLCREDLFLRYVGSERQGGRLMHKIEVTGALLGPAEQTDLDKAVLLLVWIDAETYLFDRLWLRYPLVDGKFGYIAANCENYQKLPEGLVLPSRIELVHSDKYQQFSHRGIMALEYQFLRVTSGPNKKWWNFDWF